ncbi:MULTISPECIES: hypothetical protein [unclassified Mesorhizobium]|uniref:hypothetical protein n=1 Tax=unclassified Mesorhizobium TaxID=325217 RepID=UPI0030155B51
MSARAIISAAYRAGIVPEHLYGKTQYKTLQARLSEEILYNRRNTLFFRTEPGVFFLTEFMSDPAIPQKFKTAFPARRRTRDLLNEPSLALSTRYVMSDRFSQFHTWHELVKDAERHDALKYVDPKAASADFTMIWSFSLVRRAESVLSYRIGRYRDDRDQFANRRTIGFPGIVGFTDNTLFSEGGYGAAEGALEAVLTDLDLSLRAFTSDGHVELPASTDIVMLNRDEDRPILLLIMQWNCPDWFEPTTRRLSLNDVCWYNLSTKINNIDDFEPWSRAALEHVR